MFEVKDGLVDGVLVLDYSGQLVQGEEAAFAEFLRNLPYELYPFVLISVARVPFIHGHYIKEIVSAVEWAKMCGGVIKIFGATERVQDLFEKTNLQQVVEIYPNEEEALSSCVRAASAAQ